jgi:hypothetical protein
VSDTQTKLLKLDDIRIDGGTQMRAEISTATVAEYAELLDDGVELPPLVVFNDGADHWLGGGFHRYHAKRYNRDVTARCEVRSGTVRDAILFAAGDNAEHGLRRTNADKRKAVLAVLDLDGWASKSNYEIAEVCKVTEGYVRKMRIVRSDAAAAYFELRTKHGTPAVMDTSNIGKGNGKGKAPPVPQQPPPESATASSDEAPTDGGGDADTPQKRIPGWIGWKIADQAICILHKMPHNNKQRGAALDRVVEWCNTNR